MAHTRECASGSATEHSETHIPVVTVQVLHVSGELVCSVDLKPDKDTLLGVKDNVAYSAGFCTCQLRFVTRGGDVVREGLLVRRWIEKIKPDIFANGGDRATSEVPETPICKKYNIKMVDGLGDKIRSSSNVTGLNEIK